MIAKVGYIECALEKGFINERPKNWRNIVI